MGVFRKKNTTKSDTNKKVDYLDPEFIKKRDDESNQEYNERVPIAFQPIAEQPKTNYLGEPRE